MGICLMTEPEKLQIQEIYLIGSQSKGSYGSLIQYVTSGKMTHVGIVFYVGRDGEPIPPIATSSNNMCKWIIENNVQTDGELVITVESFNHDIVLEQGFYVFETSSDISQQINAPPIIKAPNQVSGCVITPLETYRIVYERNTIIKLRKRTELLTLLIKQYWGRPYGIDSIINNLNSNLSMVCTQLSARYINVVYEKNFDMVSPTKFVYEVGRHESDESYREDDFLDKKFHPYHYTTQSIFLVVLFLGTFLAFMFVANNQSNMFLNQRNSFNEEES